MRKRHNMKIKYLLLASIFITTFSACDKECEIENERFDETDLMWFSYQIGDKLIYKNDSADIDTFTVSDEKIVNVSDAAIGFPEEQCYLPVQGSYRMHNSDSTLTTLFSLSKDKRDDKDYSFYFLMNHFLASDTKIDSLGNVEINGVGYTDVFSVEENSSELNSNISKIKFNKKVGLIQYEMKIQVTWTLYEVKRK